MGTAEHVAALRDAGVRLAEAAAQAGLDKAVPTCPEWRVRDLLAHTGGVHRWAATYVTSGRPSPVDEAEVAELFRAPADDQLIDWFRTGHAALVDALEAADPGLECWTFLPAPSPLAFWARRQAHETTVHRIDAESALGSVHSEIDPALAVDGLDELFTGFFARRRGRLVADPPVSLAVRTTDHEAAWTIRIEPDRRTTTPGAGDADCVVTGRAEHLYLFLWNRADATGLDVRGDRRVLELWREKAKITWS